MRLALSKYTAPPGVDDFHPHRNIVTEPEIPTLPETDCVFQMLGLFENDSVLGGRANPPVSSTSIQQLVDELVW